MGEPENDEESETDKRDDKFVLGDNGTDTV